MRARTKALMQSKRATAVQTAPRFKWNDQHAIITREDLRKQFERDIGSDNRFDGRDFDEWLTDMLSSGLTKINRR